MEHHAIDPENWLEHGPKLRALARHLVGEGGADDLVQETWLRAVERGRATPWSWLGRVLRNLAVDERRAEAVRGERERAAARRESGSDEGASFALHKELVAAIEQLEAPYRQAILLRYFEELPPRRIAARLGVPVKTVKTRLGRGLALMRVELDRRSGGREVWMAGLAPLVGQRLSLLELIERAGASLRAGGALLLVGAGAAVAVGVWLAWPQVPEPALAVPSMASASVAAPPEAARAPAELTATSPAPVRVDLQSAPVPPAPLALTGGLRRGRVLDAHGDGLPGAWVGFDPGTGVPAVVSGTDGVFELVDLGEEVAGRDARYATVFASRLDPERATPADEHLVVLAPAVDYAGIVRDEQGAPVAGAAVQLEIPLSFRGRFRESLERARSKRWRDRTDAEGRFRLVAAPGLGCASLQASLEHRESPLVPAPEEGAVGFRLMLPPALAPVLGDDPLHLAGEVRHASGALAPGVRVVLGAVSLQTDEDGRFELVAPREQRGSPALVALAIGEQPALFRPERDAQGIELWPPFVTLWLGPDALAITGLVRGPDGAPLAGAEVWIEDPTFVASSKHGFVTLEGAMRGLPDDERRPFVVSEADGSFALGGLSERGYRLAVMDPATLQIARAEVVAGSRGVELVLSADGLWERVAGVVRNDYGQPLAGLRVTLTRETIRLSASGGTWTDNQRAQEVRTDEAGRFELARVPRSGMKLEISGEVFPEQEVALETVPDPLDIHITSPWLGQVQVELAGAAPAEGEIRFFDEGGNWLDFYVFEGGSVWTRGGLDLGNPREFAGGRTPILRVPDAARAVVLLDAEKNELRRSLLALGEGLTTVQL